jgi:hypothetical protein
MPGRVLRMTDATGSVIAEADGPFDPSALPGEILDIATMAAHDSDGRSTADLPGITGWQVCCGTENRCISVLPDVSSASNAPAASRYAARVSSTRLMPFC